MAVTIAIKVCVAPCRNMLGDRALVSLCGTVLRLVYDDDYVQCINQTFKKRKKLLPIMTA